MAEDNADGIRIARDIVRIVDASEFLEFKYEYDQQTICGRAVIHGHSIGIIGNNGPITVHGATKAGQFIQLCSQTGIPIVYLMNTTGYIVGNESEQGGSFGAGNYVCAVAASGRSSPLPGPTRAPR